MSGLGIDFGHDSEAYSTDTTSVSNFHSRTRAHMIPKKSSMNKLRGPRPKTAEEDARRVRIVSGEPDVLGHGAYTDEDFMSPSSAGEEIVQPHQLHSLSAAVAAMNGYSTDTVSSSNETDTDQSPTLTESSVTSAASDASGAQRVKKQIVQQKMVATLPKKPDSAVIAAARPRPAVGGKMVQKSISNTSLASGYRSDGGSSLGRSAEIPRGVGRQRVSIRGAAHRKGSLQMRLAPQVHQDTTQKYQEERLDPSQHETTVSDDETEVMVPDGFGGHTRVKQPRTQPTSHAHNTAPTRPSLLDSIDMSSDRTQSEATNSRSAVWRVGSFYGPDGSETARIDHETGTISAPPSHTAGSEVQPDLAPQSSVSLSRSHTSSHGPKATLMQSPSKLAQLQAAQDEDNSPVEGSTKAAALEQNRLSRTSLANISMRSKRGLQGLEEAERGGALVSLDNYRMTYDTGISILPDEITALDQDSVMGSIRLGAAQKMRSTMSQQGISASASMSSHASASITIAQAEGSDVAKGTNKTRNRPRRSLSETNVNAALLERQGTLLSASANPLRRSKELNRLLGNSDRKLPSSAAKPMSMEAPKGALKRANAIAANVAPPPAALEQGKASKARVEVDLVLESDLIVEGGTLQGRMQIRVRKGSAKEGVVFLAQPKIRVVGFEELLADDTRHIFYHHASVIDGDRSSSGPSEPYYLHGSPTLSSPETAAFSALACFSGGPDAEGYAEGKVGSHSIPFSLELPVAKGAKGSYRGKNAVVRYIVIGSVKLKSASGADRSIAHFYRHIDLYPYLNPAVVLSNALKPIQASSSKGLFLGGSGKVHLMASLHRSTWVAGQRVYINVAIQNDTSKKINGMTLSLIRTVTLYKPRPELDLNNLAARSYLDPDACQTSTTRKKIAEEELEMGQKGSRGVVTARGWWVGVEPGQRVESSHYMQIPADALSISRGRHVEVVYSIKISIGSSLSADVSVELPLRVINFVSLDPPPLKKAGGGSVGSDASRSWAAPSSTSGDSVSPGGSNGRATGDDADRKIARLKSVDAMRSPGKTEISLHHHDQHLQAARILTPGEVAAEQTRRLQHQKSLDFINHAIRSAAARRGVDVTPTSSSSGHTPSPTGLGIGVGLTAGARSASGSSNRGYSPGLGVSSSTDGTSGADEVSTEDDEDQDEADDTKTPMASARYTAMHNIFPPGCEPYEQHHHQAHQAQFNGTYSYLPVPLQLPNYMQQMQAQMYQMQMANPAYVQRAAPSSNTMLPMLQLNNANAVSLDEIGDDYDDEEDGQQAVDQTLALNDESMAEMNMVIGSAQLDYEEFGQNDDSVLEADEHMPVLGGDLASSQGWSLRRRASADVVEDEAEDPRGMVIGEEVDEAAEVSSIMQTVEIATNAPPPSAASLSSSSISTVATLQPQQPHIPTRGDSRPSDARPSVAHGGTRPLKIIKDVASSNAVLLPEQVVRADAPTEILAKRSSTTTIPIASRTDVGAQQALSAANLKRHSDNLSYRQQQQRQQQGVVQSRHRSTHSVTGLKPLILRSKATSDGRKGGNGSSAGSRTPDVAADRNDEGSVGEASPKTPESAASDVPETGGLPSTSDIQMKEDKGNESSTPTKPVRSPHEPMSPAAALPRSSTLQAISTPTRVAAPILRHSDSVSSLMSESTLSAGDTSGALSRSHSTHNLRGASIMVPSVRNKIAMLESRSAALREFAGHTSSTGSSPAASPMRSSASTGKVAQLAERAERASSSTPSKLGRKGSFMSTAESEDGGSVVSSVVTVPEYMKQAASAVPSFNAPVLRNLK